jgi:DNA primase
MAATEDYHNPNPAKTFKPPRYRGVSYTSPINAAKDAVPVIDLADRLCGPDGLRRIGEKRVARCPLPDHEDRTPSFTVYPGDDGWYCYGCHRGGDVVDLARIAWGYNEPDAHVAAANVLYEFGHDIPQRPPAWFRNQERQKPVRDLAREARAEVMARRLWKYVFEPIVADIEDPEERVKCARELWSKLLPYAARMVEARVTGVTS